MNIVVLGGGTSPEREIALRSSNAVADALRRAGYNVIYIDTKDGVGQLDTLPADSIVFPILHGVGGEDGTIQAELEKRGLPYFGTKSKESLDCFDKTRSRRIMTEAGIPMADGVVVDAKSYWSHELITQPHVLKVSKGGSSIGTYIVRNPANIDKAKVKEVFDLDEWAIIEKLIEGPEITVPIFDVSALPVIEIRPPKDGEFDFENKYNGETQELCPPETVDENIQVAAQRLSEQVHKTLGARHFSRVDLMVNEDGGLIVLELNTIPGMTDQSLYPKSAAVAGMPMEELAKKFVEMVVRDYNITNG